MFCVFILLAVSMFVFLVVKSEHVVQPDAINDNFKTLHIYLLWGIMVDEMLPCRSNGQRPKCGKKHSLWADIDSRSTQGVVQATIENASPDGSSCTGSGEDEGPRKMSIALSMYIAYSCIKPGRAGR